MSVARVTEISSTSEVSFEDAIKQGISRASKTLRLCLHHVADTATARELFAAAGFDLDALHLNPRRPPCAEGVADALQRKGP